ncbi:MAG: hypothetical protein EBU49_09975 [Proteobacteria bacterium]|nr:hypothetical protein [Pseudomonadota bacterium]
MLEANRCKNQLQPPSAHQSIKAHSTPAVVLPSNELFPFFKLRQYAGLPLFLTWRTRSKPCSRAAKTIQNHQPGDAKLPNQPDGGYAPPNPEPLAAAGVRGVEPKVPASGRSIKNRSEPTFFLA